MDAVGHKLDAEAMPCIWVQAGMLSYRLCDRQYDCEHCELYHAIRGGGSASGAIGAGAPPVGEKPEQDPVATYLVHLVDGCQLHLDRFYSPYQFWLVETNDGRVVVGLDCQLLRVLHPVDEVVPPRVGQWLRHREPCGWVRRGHIALPLTAPLSGEVEAVNPDMIQRPTATRADATEGWLLRIRPHEALLSTPDLVRGDGTLRHYLQRLEIVKRYLREALTGEEAVLVGPTLADGGTPEASLERVLGATRFRALVDELFHLPG